MLLIPRHTHGFCFHQLLYIRLILAFFGFQKTGDCWISSCRDACCEGPHHITSSHISCAGVLHSLKLPTIEQTFWPSMGTPSCIDGLVACPLLRLSRAHTYTSSSFVMGRTHCVRSTQLRGTSSFRPSTLIPSFPVSPAKSFARRR